MPAMKVTLSAAMRARDVSRPHAEHEKAAERGGGQRPAPGADGNGNGRAGEDGTRQAATLPKSGVPGRRPRRKRRLGRGRTRAGRPVRLHGYSAAGSGGSSPDSS
jgi:hypothetical protein